MRLHLIDGTYELFRAHHSRAPGRRDPAGRDVKATVGTVSALLSLLGDRVEAPTHLAVAFDNPIESFRNDLLSSYKDSTGVDEDLLAQFGPVEDAVVALGIAVWSMTELEADDALATAALAFADDVEQVRVLTPDKDLAQVVRGNRIVQVDRARGRTDDEDGVRARLGVAPASVPDHLALVGDAADGIPGIPGFGAKTSAAVLARYPHLEDIPADGADWQVEVRGAPRLASTLRERLDDAVLYRHLATLRTDAPVTEDLDALAWRGPPAEEWLRWCGDVGVGRLRDVPARLAEGR